MSGAQSWSLKGIDPKVREAAREAAARQGMSLGEFLNQALASQGQSLSHAPAAAAQTPRMRARHAALPATVEYDDDDWTIGGGRLNDPSRLAQRLESIERRTQLAVTGLDRAVSTIARSVLGLAARIEDVEAVSTEAAERVAQALEQFRIAGETLSGKLERAEHEAQDAKRAFEHAGGDIQNVKQRLERQVSVAEEIARRAEAAASFLSSEIESRDAQVAQTLAEARRVAEEAARQAAEASADAVSELRRLQETLTERVAESETSTRRAIETAVAEVSSESRGTREALLEEVVRLEGEIARRVGSVDDLKRQHDDLIARIERAESGARESTAGLRQAAGAAIADLRNAQLTLAARVKQVEDIAGQSGAIDLTELHQAQADIAERLAHLEAKADTSPLANALAAFERRLATMESAAAPQKLGEVDGAVKTLDQALQRLAQRIAETENTANTAIRTLEETVSSLGAKVEQGGAAQETEALRALLEQRLDTMAQSVGQMVGEARTELASQLQAALDGVTGDKGLEGAIADVNRRLASAERRQAQTIEAISLEIKRMSESVDKRLRAVESRNDDAAASAVREELSRMAQALEQRFDDIEHREAAAFDRMGLEIGRLSERLEERVGAVETRSAQAIEHVGEQVARMAERFSQRHELLSRELGERMLDSEERSGARVSEAIASIMQRLQEVEEHSQEAIAPVQKAVSSVASKLEQYESAKDDDPPLETIPTPSRRTDDFPSFGSSDLSDPEPQPYVSPMDAAQPLRAGPLPPMATATPNKQPVLRQEPNDSDIYFAEDIDDLITDDLGEAPFASDPPIEAREIVSPDDDLLIEESEAETPETAPPPEDDTFWTPDGELELTTPAADSASADDDEAFEPLLSEHAAPAAQADAPAMTTLDLTEPSPAPAGKNDYLAQARKAAQAQSLPKTREQAPTPRLSLRGPSRIVLWGATGLIAALLVGGALYIRGNDDAADTNAEPDAPPPAPAETQAAPALDATDPDATFEAAPEDPFAQTAPADAAAPATGANDTPIAAAPETTQPVVAGPLAPRNVSLDQAAQSGDLTAQYELALQRLAAGRTQEGVAMLRRAADRGFPMAQYRLAKLYERGEGVETDLAVARQWTERAAAAGNRRAMHDLGVYFARGEGAPLDEAAAFRWFRQAAELGVADSQFNLGVLYQQGRGVSASASEALFWFLVAARQGDQDAGARATALEAQLPQLQVQQARARAEAFRPRAASAIANGEFGQRAWASRTGA